MAATLRWQREVTAALHDVGLTHVQFLVLGSCWWLARTRGVPSQRDIATHSGVDQMMTSQVVRALEREGLLSRTRDAEDGRVVRVDITPTGRGLAARSVAIMDAADEVFFAAATPLQGLLDQLRALGAREPSGEGTG